MNRQSLVTKWHPTWGNYIYKFVHLNIHFLYELLEQIQSYRICVFLWFWFLKVFLGVVLHG